MPASLPAVALVAEACPFGSAAVRDLLLDLGIASVVQARNGAEAVTSLADRAPQLIVLDWNVPLVNAREIMSLARGGGADPAIVVTMSEPTRSAVEAAVAAGARAVVAKPFSPRDLRARLPLTSP